MLLEAVHQDTHTVFKAHPVFLVLLNLALRFTQSLIELLDILLRMQKLTIVSQLLEILRDYIVEFLGLFHENLLN